MKNIPKRYVNNIIKTSLLGFVLVIASGCKSNDSANNNIENTQVVVNQPNNQCYLTAQKIEAHAQLAKSEAQYLAAAKAMQSCIANIINHQNGNLLGQQEVVMQMMATTTLNFIKAGDITLAKNTVDSFKETFPQQDLYFADYTSFLDTSTALLNFNKISEEDMATLNISQPLRAELARQKHWLTH